MSLVITSVTVAALAVLALPITAKHAVALANPVPQATVSPAIQGPNVYHFQGYDITQAHTFVSASLGCSSTCKVPLVNATSYFGTTMTESRPLVHWPVTYYNEVGEDVLGYRTNTTPIGVLCYLWYYDGRSNTLWDKIDQRTSNSYSSFGIADGSKLLIGYVSDTFVNLTYAQRADYVPACQ